MHSMRAGLIAFGFLLAACAPLYGNPVWELLLAARYTEARAMLDTLRNDERYELLWHALTEREAARACSLYQVIVARFPGTECDSLARVRLAQAREMGLVIVPLEFPVTAPRTEIAPLRELEPLPELQPLPALSAARVREAESEKPDADDAPHVEDSDTAAARIETQGESLPPYDQAARGNWYLQVGAFRNFDNAHRLALRLKKAGFPVVLVPRESGSGRLLLVRVGGFATREALRPAAERLKTEFNLPVATVRD